MAEDLALVVTGAAAEQTPAPHRGLERCRVPLVERVDGLYVVVAVDQRGERAPTPAAVGVQPVAVDGGMAGSGQNLDVLQPGTGHPLGTPLGRGGDVPVVSGV